MTLEQQRIAIAEACGWNPSPISKGKWCHDSNMSMAKGGAYSVWVGGDALPNYLNDLNAMHEAEKVLTEQQIRQWYVHLCNITGGTHNYPACATAAQRAEAFLRTLNLWTES